MVARRGRRFGVWDDVHHPLEGPCGKWSPSGDTGEAAGLSDRSCRFPAQQGAGCACAARKEAGEHRAASAGFSPVRAAQVAATDSLRGDQPSQSPPSQRDRSRKAQTAERGAGRCQLYYSKRGTAGAPSDSEIEPRRYDGRGRTCGRTARHVFSPGGRRSDFNILASAKC